MEDSAQNVDAPKKMPEPTTAQPAPVKEDTPHLLNRMIKIAAYPIAAISGFAVMNRDVHSSAYQKAKGVVGNPLFKDIADTYEPQFTKNAEALMRKDNPISQQEFSAIDMKIKTAHSNAVSKRIEKLGLGNEFFGLKNFSTKWNYINRSKRQQAMINGLTVSGIAIGALLTIGNSKVLGDMLSTPDDSHEKSR